MPGLHDTDPQFREVDEQMHKLWTWAVGLPGYDKKAWQNLERGIFELAMRGGEARSKGDDGYWYDPTQGGR